MNNRIILHIDVNNAFLSWTAVDMLKKGYKYDIRNKYAIIGGSEKDRKGIVLAKSTPCKKIGIKTADTIYSAKKICPNLEIYPPNYKLYKYYSDAMYNYLKQYTNIIERYSIDECFLDYTSSYKLFGNPVKLAYKIKEDLKKLYGFTVNIGVANNKLCAKMASDFEKPDKVHTLFNNEIKEKMWPLPIGDLFMIGKSTTKKLIELNILTIKDLANTNVDFLNKRFKNQGKIMWEHANGIDNEEVYYIRSDPKSISNSTSLPYDYTNLSDILKVIKELSIETSQKLREKNLYTNTITIWIKYSNFYKVNKQITLNNNTNNTDIIYDKAKQLFINTWNKEPIRALCVGVSKIDSSHNTQLSLFDKNEKKDTKKDDNLWKTIDTINNKYHKNMITYANIIKKDNTNNLLNKN